MYKDNQKVTDSHIRILGQIWTTICESKCPQVKSMSFWDMYNKPIGERGHATSKRLYQFYAAPRRHTLCQNLVFFFILLGAWIKALYVFENNSNRRGNSLGYFYVH